MLDFAFPEVGLLALNGANILDFVQLRIMHKKFLSMPSIEFSHFTNLFDNMPIVRLRYLMLVLINTGLVILQIWTKFH